MEWIFTDDLPIYQQLIDGIKQRIALGEWRSGDKLPSVRDLAISAGVNPNTMQKALAELEREGLLYSKRTAGRFVAEVNDDKELQKEMAIEYMEKYLFDMEKLGYSKEESVVILNRYIDDCDITEVKK